jgi:DEAD/DEAH box helicase domain-containing protein
MRKITFDIETSNLFQDVGSPNPEDLDLAVVCIHDSLTDKFTSYEKETLNELWPIIEECDMLIGYNSNHFDIPLLNKYYPGDLTKIKSLDILEEIRKSFGRRVKLDDVVKATLGQSKSADGLQAVVWWRQGRKQEVIDYCIQDVKVTRDVYDYALKNNKLKVDNKGIIEEIIYYGIINNFIVI